MFVEDQGISYGCKIILPKQRVRRRSLHRVAKGISFVRKGRLFLQVEESIVWYQARPQSMILKLDMYLQQQGFKKGIAENNLYINVD